MDYWNTDYSDLYLTVSGLIFTSGIYQYMDEQQQTALYCQTDPHQ